MNARRWLIRLAAAAAVVIGLVALAAAGLQTGPAKRALAGWISGLASSPGQQVAIEDLGGVIPLDMSIGRVTVADDAGTWLAVENIELAWSPLALIGDVLKVKHLTMARVDLDRLPAGQDDAAGADEIAIPQLPIGLDVGQVAIGELHLGPAIMGEPAELAVAGHVRAADKTSPIDIGLDVTRRDTLPGTATFKAVYHPGDQTFDLNVRVHEPGGKVLAQVIDRDQPLPLTVAAVGKGSLADWRGTIAVELGAAAAIDGTVALDLGAGAAIDFDVGLEASVAGLLPPALAPLIGDQARLAARGRWAAGRLDLAHAAVDAAAVGLTANGRADLNAMTMALTVSAAAGDLGAFAGLTGEAIGGRLAATAKLDGPVLQPAAALEIDVQELVAPGATVGRVSARANLLPDGSLLDPKTRFGFNGLGAIEAPGPDGLDPAIAALIPDRIGWRAEGWAGLGGTIRLRQFAVDMPSVRVAGNAHVDPASGVRSGVRLTIADLRQFRALTGLDWRGAASVTIQSTITPDGAVDGSVSGAIDGLDTGIAALAPLLGPRVQFAGAASVDPSGAIRARNVAVDGTGLDLMADGTIGASGEISAATIRVRVPDLALLDVGPPVAGFAQLDAAVSGTLAAPAVELLAEVGGVSVDGIDGLAASSRITLPDPLGGIAGQTVTRLWIQDRVVDAAAGFALAPDRVAVSDIRLTGAGVEMTGGLTVPLAGIAVAGELRGVVADLAALVPPEVAAVEGQARFALSAAGPEDLRLTLEATDLAAAGVRFDQLTVAIDGGLSRLAVRVAGSGAFNGPLALDARAGIAIDGARTDIELGGLDATVAGLPLALNRPARVQLDGPAVRLSALDLAVGAGRLTADGGMGPGGVALRAAIENLPVATWRPGAEGMVQAQLEVSGAAPHPDGALRVRIDGLRAEPAEPGSLPALDLIAAADWRAGQIEATAALEGLSGANLAARATLPLALDPASLTPAISPNAPITAAIDGTGDLAAMSPLLPLDAGRVAGQLEIAARAGGSLAAPELGGSLAVRDGLFENPMSGTVITGLTVELTGTGRELVLSRLAGSDGGAGRITGGGQLKADPNLGFPFDFAVAVEQFRAVQRDDAIAQVAGEIRLTGDLSAAALVGGLTFGPAELQIPKELPPDVVTLEVVEIGGDNPPPAPETKSGPEIALDLTIDMPGRIFLRGRGLTSEWRGNLKIGGTSNAPQVTGTIALVRGDFRLLDRTLELKTGQVVFDEAKPDDPRIEMRAETKIENFTATINVAGRASRPIITLTSNPALPEDEILAYLLFGRPEEELTAVQAVMLADGVATLTGGSSGVGVFDTVRQTIGVDYLNLKTDEEDLSSSALSVGTYVDDNILLSVERGLTADSARARVEVEVTPNVSVETDIGATGQSGVTVNVKTDY